MISHISPETESGPIDESPQVILIQLLSTYTPSDLAQHFAPVVARWHHEQGLGSSTKNGSFIKVDSMIQAQNVGFQFFDVTKKCEFTGEIGDSTRKLITSEASRTIVPFDLEQYTSWWQGPLQNHQAF